MGGRQTRQENQMLVLESRTAAYSGKLSKARELSRAGMFRTTCRRQRNGGRQRSLRGDFGKRSTETVRRQSSTRPPASPLNGRDTQYLQRWLLRWPAMQRGLENPHDDLDKRFPDDTVVRLNYLPTLRAQLALVSPGNATKATEILAATSTYELGVPGSNTIRTSLYPIYVRGEALLAAHQGAPAAAEFQKLLDWSGVALNEPIGALAHLGLARSYVLAGESSKSRDAYNDFFMLWKDADPNVPVLIQAKSEYAKLQ